jgi:DNA-directed RNA polymerase subunit beta'
MTQYNNEFDYIKIRLASPFRILQWATRRLPNGQFVGEVQKPETINYRSFKPEMDGLFCERIFGPSKSFECACGKYKQVRYEGLICERCGVELTESSARRHRMGYINLIYPVAHVWYISSRPNFMSLLLEVEEIEKKIATTYTSYSEICKKPCCYKPMPKEPESEILRLRLTTIEQFELRDERIKRIKLASLAYFVAEDEISLYGLHWDLQQYRRNRERGKSDYPFKPDADKEGHRPKQKVGRYNVPKYLLKETPNYLLGSALIKRELEKLNLKSEIYAMRELVFISTKVLDKDETYFKDFTWARKWEQQRIYKIRQQAIKRIRVLENLVGAGANPAWMILTILPVIPPALRPMIQLEGGRFATTDLNELYRRIITRNNRLLRLLEIDAPQLVIRNEKRLLQEAVDTLIDNGKRGKIAVTANNRPLKSLSDIIKGKRGRFRQNLLGKRVDYSGRSVIVVGPSLKLNQCGLPYEMGIELFQPFIIRELITQGLAINMKVAKNLIQKNEPIIKTVLKRVFKSHPIFLNRAPTLHRLGIQAFEPILVEGRAITLHPLVCSAFNADFDGDQMAVHIPLSFEAQAECYMLMLAPYNFLSPANGEPIIIPSQDMVLGCYYLTVNNIKGLLGSNHYFADLKDTILAYSQNKIEIHSTIWIRMKDEILLSTPLLKTTNLNDQTIIEYYQDRQVRKTKNGEVLVQYVKTTAGRAILNDLVQKTLRIV